MLLVLPFAIMAAVGATRLLASLGWELLPLLAIGPAIASAIGGVRYTMAAGTVALGGCLLFAFILPPTPTMHHGQVAFLAAAGVTAAGLLASGTRARQGRDLEEARLVAKVAQQVLLRPVPAQIGHVRLAVRYLSAASGAQVGGDLYEALATPYGVRLIVGDVEGKGLPGVAVAAGVLGVFREAAHMEDSLAAIAARIEISLERQQQGDEQFVTAILAQISTTEGKIELLSCGHPAPLLLGPEQPRFLDEEHGSLPLGLGHLTDEPRTSTTMPFNPGEGILFYTDGASEARNKAGEFFPLERCTAVRAPQDPGTLVDRISDEVTRYVGHAPDDDMALLLAYHGAELSTA